jgi:hypothetical protein
MMTVMDGERAMQQGTEQAGQDPGTMGCWRLPLTVRWCDDYASDVRGLDDLYQRAKEKTWNPAELDWDSELDPAYAVMSKAWNSYECMPLFRRLSAPQLHAFRANALAQQISQLLHGAQSMLLSAAAIAHGVPDMKARCCIAAQMIDDARHIEAYDRYARRLTGRYPALLWLKQLGEANLRADSVCQTIAGANLIGKGLLLGAVQRMARAVQEPLLKTLTFHVMRDASRHMSFGHVYLGRATASMHPDDREALAQFVLDAVRLVQTGQTAPADPGFTAVLAASGIDPDDFRRELEDATATGLRPQPTPGQVHSLQDLMIPVLIRAGVVTARTQALFEASGIPVPADLELAQRAHARTPRAGIG